MEKERETLSGTVQSIIYQNERTGYTVALVRLLDGAETTFVGIMPYLGAGEAIWAQGEYTDHSRFGHQFSVRTCRREMPEKQEEIYQYLASGTIKGIGAKTAAAIVDRFGAEAFSVISEHPEQLSVIKGITQSRANEVSRTFVRRNHLRLLLSFLNDYDLPLNYAATLYELYGETALEQVQRNPYLLCGPMFGGGFEQADQMAFHQGIDPFSSLRLDAALLYELSFNFQNGHVFIPEDMLVTATAQLIDADQESLYIRLSCLEQQQTVIIERERPHNPCYLAQAYQCEQFIADEMARLCRMRVEAPPRLIKMLESSQKKNEIIYTEKQKEAILLCFSHGLSLITGGPGTGKTTALLSMLDLLEESGLQTLLAAPTGRAAKRMSELCSREAKTLHRLLEATFDQTGGVRFNRNRSNPLKADVIVVDEASMLELSLAGALLDAMQPHTRLVLVGDADQLPPIGAGNLFADLLACSAPLVRLTEIFRQAEDSHIIVNAHRINDGIMPDLTKNQGDFYFSAARSGEAAAQEIVSLITRRIPDYFGIPPEEIQVICPSRKTLCGADTLNRTLQRALNPPAEDKGEAPKGDCVLREGDRVMQIRNNYDILWRRDDGQLGTGTFNGDTGTVLHVDRVSELISVRFDDRTVEYTFGQLRELEHAFAITAHKAQGSEYEAVIIPVFSAPNRLLNRCLLYTAVTRAKRLLILVGRRELVEKMVAENRKNRRFGAMKRRFEEALKA